MNYKPDENTLLSYLYGELEEKETAKLEQYFQEHPEERKRMQEMEDVLKVISGLKDKEVIAPPVFAENEPTVRTLFRSVYFKTVISIAASFLLIIVAGRLIGMEIHYGGGELRITFDGIKQEMSVQSGKPSQSAEAQRLTPETVQAMINTSLTRNNELLAAHWVDNQKMIDQSIRVCLDRNSEKIDDLVKSASQASKDQVRTFVAGLRDENLRLVKDYLLLSSTEQKRYVENLLVEFSKYMQEQRNQDLNLFQTRMSSMEQNTDQFKQETEQILSSIISNTSVTKKQNNY